MISQILVYRLFGGEVMRSFLISIRKSDIYLFCISMHHIAIDGMSHGNLISDLKKLYAHYLARKVRTIEDVLQFGDFEAASHVHFYWRRR